jgi:hypothetical protein
VENFGKQPKTRELFDPGVVLAWIAMAIRVDFVARIRPEIDALRLKI